MLRAGAANEGIELTLYPYQAAVVILADGPVRPVSAELRRERRTSLGGPWQVTYGSEPAQPVDLPHIWENEPDRRHYSGAATYTTSVELNVVDGPV